MEISSSLPLQVLLYFTMYLCPVWIVTTVVFTAYKIIWLQVVDFHAVMMSGLLIIFALIEPFRIWFGYTGNLRERVPELSGCFLLTCFPQVPICLYFIFGQDKSFAGFSLPIDVAINAVYGLLLLASVVASYRATQRIVKSQAAQFVLRRQDL